MRGLLLQKESAVMVHILWPSTYLGSTWLTSTAATDIFELIALYQVDTARNGVGRLA